MRVAGVMATATKRAMAINGNNSGNYYGKEAGGQATAATMAMGMGMGMTQRTWPLTLQLDRGVLWWQWAMDCVCVFVCVERPQKIRLDLKK